MWVQTVQILLGKCPPGLRACGLLRHIGSFPAMCSQSAINSFSSCISSLPQRALRGFRGTSRGDPKDLPKHGYSTDFFSFSFSFVLFSFSVLSTFVFYLSLSLSLPLWLCLFPFLFLSLSPSLFPSPSSPNQRNPKHAAQVHPPNIHVALEK